jgi:hypothetical protein
MGELITGLRGASGIFVDSAIIGEPGGVALCDLEYKTTGMGR